LQQFSQGLLKEREAKILVCSSTATQNRSLVIFKIGLVIAALKADGTTPEVREEFMAWVIKGQTQSMIVQTKDTGMGSAGDELRLLDFTSLQMSAMDTLVR